MTMEAPAAGVFWKILGFLPRKLGKCSNNLMSIFLEIDASITICRCFSYLPKRGFSSQLCLFEGLIAPLPGIATPKHQGTKMASKDPASSTWWKIILHPTYNNGPLTVVSAIFIVATKLLQLDLFLVLHCFN